MSESAEREIHVERMKWCTIPGDQFLQDMNGVDIPRLR